jgi:hypothetical protein
MAVWIEPDLQCRIRLSGRSQATIAYAAAKAALAN